MDSMNEKQFTETLGLFAKKGYQIIKNSKSLDDLPSFLHSFNYYPDFIIKSDNINYIVEFSSSKNFKNKEQSEKIIEEIDKHKAWKFILVQSDTVKEDLKKDIEQPKKIIEKEEKHKDRKSDLVQTDTATVDSRKDKEPSKKIIEKEEKHKDGKSDLARTDTATVDIRKDKEPSKKIIEKAEEHKDRKSGLVQTDTVTANERPEDIYGSVKKGYLKLNSVIETQQFEKHPEFILLYAWVLVESMLRKLVGNKVINDDIKLMIKETVSQGLIENSEGSVLIDLQSLYHELSQGNFEKVIEMSRVDPLIKIADKLYGKHFSK